MIAPLDLTTEEFEIYRLLYSKMDFDTFKVKYTVEQLANDSNSKLKITKKSASLIIKKFINEDLISVFKKGSKGNPTIYSVSKISELEKHKSNLKETQKELKGNSKETNNISDFNSFDKLEKHKRNTKETQKDIKGNIKVNPINDKDIDKESIERVWKLYPKKTDKKKAVIKIANIIKNIGEDKLIECINNYEKYIQSTRNGKWIQSYMGGDKFFGGRYEDYLEELKVETTIVKEEKKEVKYNPESNFNNISNVEDIRKRLGI